DPRNGALMSASSSSNPLPEAKSRAKAGGPVVVLRQTEPQPPPPQTAETVVAPLPPDSEPRATPLADTGGAATTFKQRTLEPSSRETAPAPSLPPAGSITLTAVHIVASGETLSKISRAYGKSVADIAKVNNIQPNAKLKVGDRIIVPGARSITFASAPSKPN